MPNSIKSSSGAIIANAIAAMPLSSCRREAARRRSLCAIASMGIPEILSLLRPERGGGRKESLTGRRSAIDVRDVVAEASHIERPLIKGAHHYRLAGRAVRRIGRRL